MAKVKEIRKRIKAVQATHKITRTMEMVAAGRMKRALDRMLAARPFLAGLERVVATVAADPGLEHPLLRVREPVRREAVVVLSSNRGLCGAFNTNLYRRGLAEVERARREGRAVELYAVGKKAAALFRFQGEKLAAAEPLPERPLYADADRLAARLLSRYEGPEEERVDRVTIVYARYVNALRQPPEVLPWLPLVPESPAARGDATLYSPPRPEVLAALVPLYLRTRILQAFLETVASEHVARRNAMKNATDNAEELIRVLTRNLNKARQAQITKELAEIVTAAEAVS